MSKTALLPVVISVLLWSTVAFAQQPGTGPFTSPGTGPFNPSPTIEEELFSERQFFPQDLEKGLPEEMLKELDPSQKKALFGFIGTIKNLPKIIDKLPPQYRKQFKRWVISAIGDTLFSEDDEDCCKKCERQKDKEKEEAEESPEEDDHDSAP